MEVQWQDWGRWGEVCVCVCGGGRTPKSLGAVIKMTSWFGDEKACLAVRIHWRCSPACLKNSLFMTFYKFHLTFSSVVDVCFYFGCSLLALATKKKKTLLTYSCYSDIAGLCLLTFWWWFQNGYAYTTTLWFIFSRHFQRNPRANSNVLKRSPCIRDRGIRQKCCTCQANSRRCGFGFAFSRHFE